MSDNNKPWVATIFGVTSILIGAFGLLGLLGLQEMLKEWHNFSIMLGATMAGIMFVNQFLGIICAAMVVWSGLLLLMTNKSALNIAKITSILTIGQACSVLIVSAVTFGAIAFSGAAALGSIITAVTSILHPGLVLLLVVRNERVNASFAG